MTNFDNIYASYSTELRSPFRSKWESILQGFWSETGKVCASDRLIKELARYKLSCNQFDGAARDVVASLMNTLFSDQEVATWMNDTGRDFMRTKRYHAMQGFTVIMRDAFMHTHQGTHRAINLGNAQHHAVVSMAWESSESETGDGAGFWQDDEDDEDNAD